MSHIDAAAPLDGQVALISGGARGQGREHALALAALGAKIVVFDIAAQIDSVPYPMAGLDDLDETTRLVRAVGGQCESVVADIRDASQIGAAVEHALAAFGRIDIVVANAGITSFGLLPDITDEMWDDMIATNLTGVFKLLRIVLPHLAGQHYGRVIVIASMAGRRANISLSHYSASKWGVIGLVKVAALEMAEQGVTVNAVCPAAVHTDMLTNDATYRRLVPHLDNPTADDVVPALQSMNVMKKQWIEPNAVARAVTFLACDAGDISGVTLEIGLGDSASLS